MYKDYYLILGIGKDATPEEIEKAFKDANANLGDSTSSKEYQDLKEAFTVLSHPEMKILYDKELTAYDESDDLENYEIKDQKLANMISSLQVNEIVNQKSSSKCDTKKGKGCLWVIIFVVTLILQTCFSVIMKEKGRISVRNSYSYEISQNK